MYINGGLHVYVLSIYIYTCTYIIHINTYMYIVLKERRDEEIKLAVYI